MPQAVAGGVPLRELGPGELAALEPGVDFAVHGALFNAEGATVRTPAFVVELARLLTDQGVEIHPFTEVLDFEVAGDRVTAVRTTRGDFRPAETVVAAGSWSTDCVRRLGVGLELQPVKGYSVTVRMPANAPGRPVLLGEPTVAVTPLGDRLRVAGSLELAGLDPSVSRRRVDGLLRAVRDFLPGLERTETVEVWRGLPAVHPGQHPAARPGRAVPEPDRRLWTRHDRDGAGAGGRGAGRRHRRGRAGRGGAGAVPGRPVRRPAAGRARRLVPVGRPR